MYIERFDTGFDNYNFHIAYVFDSSKKLVKVDYCYNKEARSQCNAPLSRDTMDISVSLVIFFFIVYAIFL